MQTDAHADLEESPEDWRVLAFLAQLAEDLELGGPRDLATYLALFPGGEERIAREYLAALDRLRGVSQEESSLPAAESALRRIGPYEIQSELGRGGQGIVFLAYDRRLQRRVALKVLREGDAGALSPERFRREALVASRLDHPGLCAIYDAGESDGWLYTAMRYVEGESLAVKLARARKAPRGDSRRSRALDLVSSATHTTDADGERSSESGRRAAEESKRVLALVELLERVARALHVAHQAGVVHRDLKPGNILVTPEGEPVLVDFGLARDEESDLAGITRTGELFGTPAYMSPEQVAGKPSAVGPASDLWSLGVVLWECLTLELPFGGHTREQMFEAIRWGELPSLRKRHPEIPRDLATVLCVALEKNPQRRYASALELAEDLRRVRERRPPQGRPSGRALRLWRWTQRNPVLAACAGSLFLSLSVGLAWSESRRKVEAELRSTAVQRAEDLRRLARSLLVDLHGAIEDLPGAARVSRSAAEKSLEFLALLRDEAGPDEIDPPLRSDLILAHLEVGDVLGNPLHPNLGMPAEAGRHYDAALALARLAALRDEPGSAHLLAACHERLGELADGAGEPVRALQCYREALELLTQRAPTHGLERARLHRRIGGVELRIAGREERHEGARASYGRALETLRALREQRPDDVELLLEEFSSRVDLAQLLTRLGEDEAALGEAERALELSRAAAPEARASIRARLLECRAESVRVQVIERRGDPKSARALLSGVVTRLEGLASLDEADEQVQRLLIQAQQDLGLLHLVFEDHAAAQRSLELSLERAEHCAQRFGKGWTDALRVEGAMRLGQMHYERFAYDEAIALLREATEIQRRSAAAHPEDDRLQEHLGQGLMLLGSALVRARRPEEGAPVLGEALTCFDALARRDPGVAAHRSARLGILQQFAEMAFQRGNMAEASERYAQAAELQRTMVEEDPSPSRLASLGVLLQGLGEAQFQAQRIAAADATTSEAIEVLERAARERPGDPFAVRLLALSLVNRARFLRSRGQREDAISFAQRALELARGLRDVGPVETPKLLHTLARAQVILGVLHLEGGARSAALEACRAATATLEQLPPEQRRLAEPYASAYAQLAARLGS